MGQKEFDYLDLYLGYRIGKAENKRENYHTHQSNCKVKFENTYIFEK